MSRMQKGLNKKIVLEISQQKNEPGWMTDFRLKALEIFESKPMPSWGANLSDLSADDIYFYIKPIVQHRKSWDDVPAEIQDTFNRLGVPQAEKEMLAGVSAQFESEVIYKKLKERWEKKGVVFLESRLAYLK